MSANSGWSGANPSDWARETKAKLEAVFKNSVQELAIEASKTIPNGGRVPVKTGNLARSVGIDNKPLNTVFAGPFKQDFISGLSALKLGDTAYIGWQAAYARRMNYGYVGTDALGRKYGSAQAVITTGYSNRSGYGFAEAAAAKWPQIVDKVVIELRQRGGFSSTTIARRMK